jgi:hypothetical protein
LPSWANGDATLSASRGILGIATRRTELRNEGLFNAAVAMRDLIGIIDRETAI